MNKVKLLFGVHNHQPVGNFQHVIDDAFKRAYIPFVETIANYPDFKLTYHFTGVLLKELVNRYKSLYHLIKEQVKRGQAEIVISGFYEPVLASIPPTYRLIQVFKAKEFVSTHFKFEPVGLWLTERVYESEILRELLKLNLKYLLVDDHHFLSLGIKKEYLYGYYLTDYNYMNIAIFPIDQKLRYLLPFHSLEEFFDYKNSVLEGGGKALIIFDDGEKFGIWPNTYEWVYEKGWLKNFLEKVLSDDTIQTQTFSEFLAENPPNGIVYLPSASYFEMGEWSLIADKGVIYKKMFNYLKREFPEEEIRNFLRGGIWRNYFVKYRESNYIHKRCNLISKRIENTLKIKEDNFQIFADHPVVEDILKAQCNDAYWHGVFGGIYLPHLRNEVWKNILKATKKLRELTKEKFILMDEDFDLDGVEEIYFENDDKVLVFKKNSGECVEISSLKSYFNWLNVLGRNFEHYHVVDEDVESDSAVPSIHEIRRKTQNIESREITYDMEPRLSFKDFLLQGFKEPTNNVEFIKPSNVKYEGFSDHSISFLLEFKDGELKILKKYSFDPTYLVGCNYKIVEGAMQGLVFAFELNLHLPYLDFTNLMVDKKSYTLDKPFELENFGDKVVFVSNGRSQITLKLKFIGKIQINPIYTLSQSESGYEKICQGHCIIFIPSEDVDTWGLSIEE